MPEVMRAGGAVHAAAHVPIEGWSVFAGTSAAPHVHLLRAHLVVECVVDLGESMCNGNTNIGKL